MKKINVYAMLFIALLSLQSCEKDFDETSKTTTKNGKGFKILSYSSPNSRGVVNNILSFDSPEEFEATVDSLEMVFDNFQTQFTNQYVNFSDEDLNDLVINQNLDLEEPLSNFETSIAFTSLRIKINQEESTWLQKPDPDFDNCPQFHPVQSHAERSLWNDNGEIIIAGKIYKYDDERTKFITIEDGDIEKLILINDGDMSIYSNSNVTVENLNNGTSQPGECIRNKTTNATITNSNGLYKMLIGNRLKSKSWEFGKHHMYASTYTYAKVNGSWNGFVTNIYVGCVGDRYHGCTNTSPTTINKTKRAKGVNFDFKRENAFSVKFGSVPTPNWCSMVSRHRAFDTANQGIFNFNYARMNYAGSPYITYE